MVETLKTRRNTSGTWCAIVKARVPFDISGQGRSCQEGDVGAETGRIQLSRLQTGKAVQTATAMAAAQRPTLGTLEKEQGGVDREQQS